MKSWKTPIRRVLALALAAVPLLAGPLRADAPDLTEGIAAVVNGEPITFLEINRAAATQEADARKQFQGDELNQKLTALKRQIGNDLIDRKLIVQEFYREGEWLPESYADQRYQAIVKENYQGDENRLGRELAPWGETVDEYKAQIVEGAIVAWMTKKYVDDKVAATDPAQIAGDRAALRAAWLASLHQAAAIETRW